MIARIPGAAFVEHQADAESESQSALHVVRRVTSAHGPGLNGNDNEPPAAHGRGKPADALRFAADQRTVRRIKIRVACKLTGSHPSAARRLAAQFRQNSSSWMFRGRETPV